MVTRRANAVRGRLTGACGAILLICGAVVGEARAEEGVEKAASVAASLGTQRNDTVHRTDGFDDGQYGPVAGLTGILSVGPVALGASGELSTAPDGIANRTLGGLVGVRLPVAERLRLLLLGEGGMRFFSNFGFLDSATPSEVSLPYVGGRVGITWLLTQHFDLGATAFARTDIGEGTMMIRTEPLFGGNPTTETLHMGGVAGGVELQVGFHFDTTRPFTTPIPRPPRTSQSVAAP